MYVPRKETIAPARIGPRSLELFNKCGNLTSAAAAIIGSESKKAKSALTL